MEIFENERIDFVNDKLSLIQKTDGLTFGTDALLLSAYISGGYKRGLEIGSGSGIISMLILTRERVNHVNAIEVQADYAVLTERNAKLNNLGDRLSVICSDIRDYNGDEVDLVFTNPPYMKNNSGRMNLHNSKCIARHEIKGDIFDFLAAARKNLKFGGAFYCVYRPDRLADLIFAMKKNEIEPKRITAVHANTLSEPSMLLIEGKRGAKSSLKFTKPFIIYNDELNRDYSDEMNYVMENGAFPAEYQK